MIVVLDYAAGQEKSWEDLRRAFRAWAAQDGPAADEFLLAESAALEGAIPSDLLALMLVSVLALRSTATRRPLNWKARPSN